MLALSGCGSQDWTERHATFPAEISGESSAETALSPAVRIQAALTDALGETRHNHLGSGFVVSAEGHVVTAFHVIENFRQLQAAAPADEQVALVAQPASIDGQPEREGHEAGASVSTRSWPLRAVAEDPGNDLALLQAMSGPEPAGSNGLASGVARLALAPPAPDTAIVLSGYPYGARTLQSRSGRILVSASALGDASHAFDAPSWFQALGTGGFLLAEVETQRGNSGSPVSMTESGDVIGLCSAILLLNRSQLADASESDSEEEPAAPFTLVIPARSIAALLDRHGVAWIPAD
jgi:hypothetical protein